MSTHTFVPEIMFSTIIVEIVSNDIRSFYTKDNFTPLNELEEQKILYEEQQRQKYLPKNLYLKDKWLSYWKTQTDRKEEGNRVYFRFLDFYFMIPKTAVCESHPFRETCIEAAELFYLHHNHYPANLYFKSIHDLNLAGEVMGRYHSILDFDVEGRIWEKVPINGEYEVVL